MAFSRSSQRPCKVATQPPHKKPPKERPQQVTNNSAQGAILSSIRHLPENQRDWSQSMRHLLRELLQEESRSMQAMLNSSINHFTQYLADPHLPQEDIEAQNHHLLKQNHRLKEAIEELRAILRQKLEAALRKQREELNMMMQDYIQLIEKLLADKETFAARIEEEAERAILAENLLNEMAAHQQRSRLQQERSIETLQRMLKEQEGKIDASSVKLDGLTKENTELKNKIIQLESKHNNILQAGHGDSLFQHDDATSKTKLMLELLEDSESEVKRLKQRLKQAEGVHRDEMIQQLKTRMAQMEEQHELEFNEYEQSMRQVLTRKDEQIQRLTKALQAARPHPSLPQHKTVPFNS